jgi:hypothetical protein
MCHPVTNRVDIKCDLLRAKHVATVTSLMLKKVMTFDVPKATLMKFPSFWNMMAFKLVRKCNLDSP